MNALKVSFWAVLLILSGTWLLADTLIPDPFNYFTFRRVFVQYSGVIAIGVMSVAMILTLRSRWIERSLNGLDKMYRLHKWLGITALLAATSHWWMAKGTKWMVGWGWLMKPERKRMGQELLSPIEQTLRSQRDFAESAGEWAFYATVILITLALVKRFPYHLFKKTHYWLAIAYLVFVYHSVVFTKFAYWFEPIGWIAAVLMLGGTAAALLVLTGRVGHGRKAQGVIESVTYYPELKVIESTAKINNDWKGHTPGQFAFVTSNQQEGPHPYTIASAWDPEERTITLIIKELGDWTNQLNHWLKKGLPICVEGPYGCFNFQDKRPRQIWIGAGIGITPFIARMKHLAKQPSDQIIDLFHPTSDYSQTAMEELEADAKAANVNLHLMVTPKDGRLTPEGIRAAIPDWSSASVWYCGPAALGDILDNDMRANGLSAKDFHRELFDMR